MAIGIGSNISIDWDEVERQRQVIRAGYAKLAEIQKAKHPPVPQITPYEVEPLGAERQPIRILDEDVGAERTLTIDRRNIIYDETNRPIADYEPETGQFYAREEEPEEPWGHKAIKGIEYAFAPFSLGGQGILRQAGVLPVNPEWEEKQKRFLAGEMSKEEARQWMLTGEAGYFKEAMPGGEQHEKYRELPLWQQMIAEAPGYIASGGITAGGVRAALAPAAARGGIKAVAPKVARAALKPVAMVEEAPAKAIGKLAAKVKPKPVPEAKMPTIQELIDANYDPNVMARVGQKLTEMPGMAGKANRALLPMQAAKTEGEKAAIAWGALQNDIAPSLARIEMDAVYAVDSPFLIDATTGFVKNVVPKSAKYKPYIQAIMEFPNRYRLSAVQRAEVDLLDDLLRTQLKREMAAGVKVFPTKLKPGQKYFPRFITELQDLETKALKEIRRGVGRRPGIKPGSFRDRYYEEVLDGMAAGKRYSTDYRAAVEMRLAVGNKAIADAQFAKFLEPMSKLPVERVDIATRRQYWGAARQYAGIKNFQKVINRVKRGEKIPEGTLKAQERRFPELGVALREAGKDKTKLNALIKKARAVEPLYQKEYWQARRAATKAMRVARVPILGKEGAINHSGLQGRIFPIDVSEPTNAIIRGQIESSQVLNQMAKLNAVARMGQTAIDTGFVFIQGLLTLVNHPRQWGRAFVTTLKTLRNPKYAAQFGEIHRLAKLEIAQNGGAPFAATEFTEAARRGGWLLRIPKVGKLFERFGTAFESFIDSSRILIYEARKPHYIQKLGRELTTGETRDLVTSIDHMVGISSMARLGMSNFTKGLASNVLYAPRYYLAFVSLLGRAFQGGIGGDLARKSLAKFLVAVPAFMSAMAYATGQKERLTPTEDKPIPKMFDPRSGEFMSIELADTHMGLGGVWIAAFRLLGGLSRSAIDNPEDFASIDPHENPVLRYGYGRGSPIIGGVIDLATRHNYLGERTTDTPQDYLRLAVDRTFPFWLAGKITDVPPSGWQKGMAEWWGLRSWMIQYQEEAQRYAESHIPDIPDEMIMPWQKAKAQLTYDDLNNEQRAWLLINYEDYREAEEKRRGQKLEKGTDFEVADIRAREILEAAYHSDLEEIAKGVSSGRATIPNYQDQSEYMRQIRSGEYQYRATLRQFLEEERWEETEEWVEENAKPEDKAYDKYMELRANPPKINGVPDWDKWNTNIKAYLARLDPATRAYIERRKDDWVSKLPPTAQRIERLIIDCESILDEYYRLPEGKARIVYREAYPERDARLVILRPTMTLRTRAAYRETLAILEKYGVEKGAVEALFKFERNLANK